MYSWIKRSGKRVVFVTFAVLGLSLIGRIAASRPSSDDSEHGPKLALKKDKSAESKCDPFYMVVSTIDGKVSALDLNELGQLAWSIDADSHPLLSSSLANLEMIRNGKKMRLIPALDGALYQFDGEKVEPLPMSAESLLSSTYQLSDDAMIVGSKSRQNFGVDLKTGELQYSCGTDGCTAEQREAEESGNSSDILVITRLTQVIRSVDNKNGLEKWNFSVGEHLLNLAAGDVYTASQIEDKSNEESADYSHFFSNKKASEQKCSNSDDEGDANFLRLVVPEGKVVALNKQDSSRVAWQHKFTSPIARAWLYRKGKLQQMNLFGEQHMPTMSTFTPDDVEKDSSTQPLLYIGSHQKMLYIQPSPGMEAVLRMYSGRRIGHVFDPKLKVAWRPYQNTASFRTPIFGGNRQRVPSGSKDNKDNWNGKTSLAAWHEEYPFDTGYFLYPEFKDARATKKPMLVEDLRRKIDNSMINIIMSYYKEISVMITFSLLVGLTVDLLSLLVGLTVDLLTTNFFFPQKFIVIASQYNALDPNRSNDSDNQLPLTSADNSFFTSSTNSSFSGEYVSRFETDFDCVQILGKGGFGVVMEAVNKVDEQHYAVKRIKLPRGEGAKEKVLREVKALAKLEHVGIVRYFNAWVETPPPGWQEGKDGDLGLSDASRQTLTQLTASPSRGPTAKNALKNSRKKIFPFDPSKKHHQIDEDSTANTPVGSRPYLDITNTNTDSVVFAAEEDSSHTGLFDGGAIINNGSGEFTVHSNLSDTDDSSIDSTSTSHCILRDRSMEACEQSLTIEDEEHSDQSYSRSSIPFSNYSTNSSLDLDIKNRDNDFSNDSVVFEQSKSLSKDCDDVLRKQNNSEGVNDNEEGVDFFLSSGDGVDKVSDEVTPTVSKSEGVKVFLYIQMQLYRKDTLKEWLANNTLNRNRLELMEIFDQLLCAVDYVHSCGLMHRDLKPSNIFFSAEGVVKVGDFGLVTPLTVQEEEEEEKQFSCQRQTQYLDGQAHTADVGTTLYMSPEQMARKPYNLKVDVFSLGLIFLELWMPFGTQMERIRTLQDARNKILPARFERELPVECELVRKMTSKEPQSRPDIKEIMSHSLFKDFAPNRFVPSLRTRTISNNSNDSSASSAHHI